MASTSKVYEGRRTIDGLVVTVDGNRLDEHYDVKRFTTFGFEWSYEGASPQQLALAIGRGDAKGAAAATDRLMDYVESFTRATLQSR